MDGYKVPMYKWAGAVKELGAGKCAFCGAEERLEAHHIIPYSRRDDLINDLSNGVLLCHSCHLRAHKGNFYNAHRENRGEHVSTPPESEAVLGYLDRLVTLIVPKGRKEDIEAFAKGKGLSINGYIGELIREDMRLSEEAWKAAPEEGEGL